MVDFIFVVIELFSQYGAEPFEQQQFGTAGVEGVKAFLKSYRKRCVDFAHKPQTNLKIALIHVGL